jgi:hypothetical protein
MLFPSHTRETKPSTVDDCEKAVVGYVMSTTNTSINKAAQGRRNAVFMDNPHMKIFLWIIM